MPQKYETPPFLPDAITPTVYRRWLKRKAAAHSKRDRKRGNTAATVESYKTEIHRAVVESAGFDDYTGEALDWTLISQYDNDQSKVLRRAYKASFALLPTVDHVEDGLGHAKFKICGWRTNDLKNDLSHSDLVDLCRKIVSHSERIEKI